jgi:hypothetical protein
MGDLVQAGDALEGQPEGPHNEMECLSEIPIRYRLTA